MNEEHNENLIAFHPGYYVKEYLNYQGMKQSELAERLNISEKTVSYLVNGQMNVDNDMADKLALVLGTSPILWKDLNNKYLETKDKIDKEKQLEEEKLILQQMDYAFWSRNGLVKQTSKLSEKVDELKKFLRISSLEVLEKSDFLVQYKTSIGEVKTKNTINANAWVQTALNLGNLQKVDSINLSYLKAQLSVIRSMTMENPENFIPKLEGIFKHAGVAFVIIPNLKNCGINGAVKWLGNDKVLLAINDRRKSADLFWFALFHEIKHIFQQKKGHIIVTSEKGLELDSPLNMQLLEKDADNFAQNYLIDQDEYDKFVAKQDFSYHTVETFANKIAIQPGIVIGRLQRDKYVPFDHLNSDKQRYKIIFNNNA